LQQEFTDLYLSINHFLICATSQNMYRVMNTLGAV